MAQRWPKNEKEENGMQRNDKNLGDARNALHNTEPRPVPAEKPPETLRTIYLNNYHMLQSWHSLPVWVWQSLRRNVKYFMSRPLEQTVVRLRHILLLFSTDRVKLERGRAKKKHNKKNKTHRLLSQWIISSLNGTIPSMHNKNSIMWTWIITLSRHDGKNQSRL